MKKVAGGVVVIFVILILLAFVTSIIAGIDTSHIVGSQMESVWNTIADWSGLSLSMMTPLMFLIALGLIVYAIYRMIQKR